MATVPSFAPTAGTFLTASAGASANVVLPTTGTPTIALVTNQSDVIAFVALGGSTVAASIQTSMPILPRSQAWLTIGTNTYIAAITLWASAGLNITVGN